jgi:hypothetical protein
LTTSAPALEVRSRQHGHHRRRQLVRENCVCAGQGFAYRTGTAETLNWILASADYTYGGITVIGYDGTTRIVSDTP